MDTGTLKKDPLRIKTIDHVLISIPVGSKAAAVDYFSVTLGLDYIPGDHPNGAEWFRMGDKELHIREEENINNAKSSRHIAMVTADLEASKRYLESRSVDLHYSTNIEGRQRLFFRDPWGNRFELLEYL